MQRAYSLERAGARGSAAWRANHLSRTSGRRRSARRSVASAASRARPGSSASDRECGEAVGHVGGVRRTAPRGARAPCRVAGGDQVERGIAQRAPSGARPRPGSRAPSAGASVARDVRAAPAGAPARAAPQRVAGRDGSHRDRRPAPISRARSASLGSGRTSAAKAGSRRASASQEALASAASSAAGLGPVADRRSTDQRRSGERLRRLPAVERVAVVCSSAQQIARRSDRGRAAPGPRSRAAARAPAAPRHPRRRCSASARSRTKHARPRAPGRLAPASSSAPSARRGRAPSGSPAAACRLARRRRQSSARDRAAACGAARRSASRRSARGVPACSYQRANGARSRPVRVGEGGEEILDRGGRAVVVARSSGPCRARKASSPIRVLQHADDLGAFLVDGRRVEVVDLAIGAGRTGWASGPASSGNWRARSVRTSAIRWTGARAHGRRRIPGRGRPSGLPSGRAGTSRGR